ncbi:bifunctional adenosylcobinamide kinase/adenosylcobinamide-phosphate guanylyltransferase [Falsiroseomonas sp.]|uniref:bifunctional adenosylcobinamide kinase/adenosylcobinamide-phosphate guanylyltransferase n=1 Tax=Falsiroseomonas sp. TaxID=2870721 RepID=UPI002725C7C7|nr:bifunctional adenosylcobinamide kinase/adenosylcobinamide-phosphate guanylyltransferase [Falsiroseomonas sp.]MDO9501225.1 bifunctional adenosylcobinamide kinase/adenosylcobinamide-phosphate guanylyltransferase [Falsiroseomonas sp.]
MNDFTLILGGARSGKSRLAEARILDAPHTTAPLYIATAQAFDDEMTARIAVHRDQRAGAGWQTIEAPLALTQALEQAAPAAPVLIDCLTLWLSNHLLAGSDLPAEGARLAHAIAAHPAPLIAVANEVGLGIVPDNALARRFRDEAGRLNQQLAAQAGRVILVTAGLPLALKGSL